MNYSYNEKSFGQKS